MLFKTLQCLYACTAGEKLEFMNQGLFECVINVTTNQQFSRMAVLLFMSQISILIQECFDFI